MADNLREFYIFDDLQRCGYTNASSVKEACLKWVSEIDCNAKEVFFLKVWHSENGEYEGPPTKAHVIRLEDGTLEFFPGKDV